MKTTIKIRLIITSICVAVIPLVLVGITLFMLGRQQSADIYPFVDTMLMIIGLFIISMFVIAGGIAFLQVRQIMTPIEQLTKITEAISAGDLSHQLPINHYNEFAPLALAFNSMVARLHDLIDSLEDQLRTRTKALETVIAISQQSTADFDIDELLQYVVNRLNNGFGFYHTHIYLIESETDDLVLHQNSLEQCCPFTDIEHRISSEATNGGLVAVAYKTRHYIMANNVHTHADFYQHPLMPKTCSELAVPLQTVDNVVGVLDIHSEQLDRFTDEDIAFIQAIANQLALTIAGLHQTAKTKQIIEEVAHLNKRLTRTGWDTTLPTLEVEKSVLGYRFHQGETFPVDTPHLQHPSNRIVSNLLQANNSTNAQPNNLLNVPLKLRGEVIGLLNLKRNETSTWTEEELNAVETVANQISLALENARLSTEQEKTIFKLQELDRLKSEFLTSMSHELRTPLNAILGFADVLLQGIDGELTEYAQNDVQLIYNSGQHLLTLINDILDISKIEAGMMEIVPEAIEIFPILKEVIAASKTLVNNKPVELVISASEDLPEVYADNIRLKQILLNLVGNAAKFTNTGSITLQAILSDEQPSMIRFSVIDTGIGIPPEKQDAIFERFKQADMTTTREYGGTGLGLAICRQLTLMHGGDIGVSSTENVGSEFYFTIPLASTMDIEN